jgi:hypothetical protein
VLVEPILQGAGGMIMWPAEFLTRVRQLCTRYGTLMIADEVLTGFGRTGKLFACEHRNVQPDLMCLSKALTGGYLPLGVTAASEAIFEAFLSQDRRKTFFHGHSFTANPPACAVARASLDLLRTEGGLDRVRELETLFRSRQVALFSLPPVGEVPVLGGVIAIELVRNRETRDAGGYLDRMGPELMARFLNLGLLLRPLGMAIGKLNLLNSRPALVGEFSIGPPQIVRREFYPQPCGVLQHHAINRGGGHPCPDKAAAFVDSSEDRSFFNGHGFQPGIHRLLGPIRDRHRTQAAALADQVDQTPAAVPLPDLVARERGQFLAPDAGR